MARRRGPTVRLKLTLSYAAFVVLAAALLLVVVRLFLLRYVPDPPGDTPREPGVLSPGSPTRSELLDAFAPKAAVMLAFIVLFGLGGGWLLAGRMLAPLTQITRATRKVAAGSLAHRIEMEGRQDELRELADAFDGMLERLEAHVAEQQRFAANASHELRTPLAITQTLLDVARKDASPDRDELIDRLHAANSRAIDLTEALLMLSRADQQSFARTTVDLSLLAEEAAETLLPLAERRHVTVHSRGEPAFASGSSTLLLQVCTNLLHNAIVHNVPDGGDAWISTSAQPDHVLLTVENTGPVLPSNIATRLAEPFLRATERVRSDHAGAGLGLAIVDRVARAHDGTLTLEPLAAGGLRATVRLPRSTTPAPPSGHERHARCR